MALKFTTTARNNMLDELLALMDAGAGPALIRIYDGTRATDANTAVGAQVLLAELTCTNPAAAAATSGLLDLSTITDETAAIAGGNASWFRVVDSNGNTVMDGDVGAPTGSDLNLNSTTITINGTVSITNFDINAGNA